MKEIKWLRSYTVILFVKQSSMALQYWAWLVETHTHGSTIRFHVQINLSLYSWQIKLALSHWRVALSCRFDPRPASIYLRYYSLLSLSQWPCPQLPFKCTIQHCNIESRLIHTPCFSIKHIWSGNILLAKHLMETSQQPFSEKTNFSLDVGGDLLWKNHAVRGTGEKKSTYKALVRVSNWKETTEPTRLQNPT